MNFYIDLIKGTVDYVERNIHGRLSAEVIAREFNVSEFHFNRIFKTVTGTTLKQYILSRKLTNALQPLAETGAPVIDIAYDLGFEYPEVFSRAFKKQFGLAPSRYRADRPAVDITPKANIVERDFINYRGSLALKGDYISLEALTLWGSDTEVAENSEDFKHRLQAAGEAFLAQAGKCSALNQDTLYAAVNCHGEDSNAYTVFYGMKARDTADVPGLKFRVILGGRYVRFVYSGDMFDIRESFVDDLYRWVIVKEVTLAHNGVGMLNIFKRDYPSTHEVQILVPLK